MRYSISLVVIFVLLVLALVRCKEDEEPSMDSPEARTDTLINENVHVMDPARFTLLSDSISLGEGHLVYDIVGTVPTIRINDIVVGENYGGYIKRVTSVDQRQGSITIEGEPGTMEDVFDNAEINFSTSMADVKNGRTASGHEFDLTGMSVFKSNGVGISIEDGMIGIDGDWEFFFKFKESKLDSFELSCKNLAFDGQLNLAITATETASIADHTSTLARGTKYMTVFVHGVPVVVYMEVELRCHLSAAITASAKQKVLVNASSTANVGLEYNNSSWKTIFNESSNSAVSITDDAERVSGQVNLAIYPHVSFRLYQIIGPYASVGIREFVRGNLSPSANWDFSAGAWIQASVGAQAEIFGYSLFDVNKEWNTDTLLYETPAKIEKTAGDNQSGPSSEFLVDPIQVRVLDTNGKPQSKVPVRFTVTAGGGSVENLLVLTDNEGYAETRWKIGSQIVIQTVQATVQRADETNIEGAPVEFAAAMILAEDYVGRQAGPFPVSYGGSPYCTYKGSFSNIEMTVSADLKKAELNFVFSEPRQPGCPFPTFGDVSMKFNAPVITKTGDEITIEFEKPTVLPYIHASFKGKLSEQKLTGELSLLQKSSPSPLLNFGIKTPIVLEKE